MNRIDGMLARTNATIYKLAAHSTRNREHAFDEIFNLGEPAMRLNAFYAKASKRQVFKEEHQDSLSVNANIVDELFFAIQGLS